MKLTFKIRFHTKPGQSLLICGNHPLLGGTRPADALAMQYEDWEAWKVTLEFPEASLAKPISYRYVLREADGTLEEDVLRSREYESRWMSHGAVTLVDSWNAPGYVENVFFTEPFRDVLLRPNQTSIPAPSPSPRITHLLRVKAPLLSAGQTLCLLGGPARLGNWSTAHPILLTRKEGSNYLEAELDLSGETFPVEYKYGVFDWKTGAFVRFETGDNRWIRHYSGARELTVIDDGFARLPAETWRGAGVAIPVFSLRSEESFGVGEFLDLKKMAGWAKTVGLKLIQILPVNDTTATYTWTDSYPYTGISAFALHPVYLNLASMAGKGGAALLDKLEPERLRLNALDAVDYEVVTKTKLEFIKQMFPAMRRATFARKEYKEFFEKNKKWLVPYAAFCHLRDKFGTADFNAWPAHRQYDAAEIAKLTSSRLAVYDEIAMCYFIQFHLHLQLREAAEHLHASGVILKGDIPIGVSRNGVDAWEQPAQFHMDVQAGAPPDAFAEKGQNWGFPTYNWPRMMEDSLGWWRRRFEQMGGYFDAFRIDHILGFFRIWSIPADAVEGILGYFVPAISVEEGEFAKRGIPFERERYLRPFINDHVLGELFGNDREDVRRLFLKEGGPGGLMLKPEFATQRQVEKHFTSLESNARNLKIKTRLFDLISNVILFEAVGSGGRQFHFRLGMDKTPSFKQLRAQTQAQLKELYVDYFFRRQDALWKAAALQKLLALKQATNMLICGEDLGMVPDCVPDVMKQLGLLSLEIQRMPKALGRDFSRPADAPYLSVVTPSTHDMSTIRGWWEEDRAVTQKFYNVELGKPGEAPKTCDAAMCETVVRQHLQSPAMWSIFQLQDLMGVEDSVRREDVDSERINVPANPRHYWRYRMHLTLEQLQKAEAFSAKLKAMIEESGRRG